MAAKKLTQRELDEFSRILLQRRNFVTGNIEDLENGVRTSSSNAGDVFSGDSADIGSEVAEQDLSLSLMEAEGDIVQKIDDALNRIHNKAFGVCSGCEEQIAKARLKAIPWAALCIECQRNEEAM